jgi:hypothetical protein
MGDTVAAIEEVQLPGRRRADDSDSDNDSDSGFESAGDDDDEGSSGLEDGDAPTPGRLVAQLEDDSPGRAEGGGYVDEDGTDEVGEDVHQENENDDRGGTEEEGEEEGGEEEGGGEEEDTKDRVQRDKEKKYRSSSFFLHDDRCEDAKGGCVSCSRHV